METNLKDCIVDIVNGHAFRLGKDWPTTEVEGLTVHLACKRDLEGAVESFAKTVVDGSRSVAVHRWASNNAIPFDDMFALWEALGYVDAAERAAAKEWKDEETSAFLTEYRKVNKGRKRSAEELHEMRAAFGPGATVVDVITGETVTL